jgi:serpin B
MRTLILFRKFPYVIVLLSLLLSACAPAAMPGTASVAKSDLRRLPAEDINPVELAQLAANNRAFAIDLYQQLRSTDGNLIYSPYSITIALAMTYAGARGQTAGQMAEVLHFNLPDEQLHPAFNALDLSLASLGDGSDGLTLEIANSLWAQQDHHFQSEFLDLLAQNYGSGVRLVDFQNQTETARQAINAWVEARTHDKIQDLLKEGTLDALVRLVLVNAVYFKADWQTPFDEKVTQDDDFHLLDGNTVSVPMMTFEKDTLRLPFSGGQGYVAVGLPYANPEVEMVILLPDSGQFDDFEAALNPDRLGTILGQMHEREIGLALPKFKSEREFNLQDILQKMGMADAFNPDRADFSGMDGTQNLYLSQAVHKAYVQVDEQGSEAAAATGIVAQPLSASVSPRIKVDRPFIYLIYDRQSGTILFMGRMLDPSQ